MSTEKPVHVCSQPALTTKTYKQPKFLIEQLSELSFRHPYYKSMSWDTTQQLKGRNY